MLHEIEFNSREHTGYDGPVFIHKGTGETLLLHSVGNNTTLFINPNDKRAYECSPQEFNQLVTGKILDTAEYSLHCFSLGSEENGSLHYCLGASNLTEAHFKLLAIAESFDKHDSYAKGVYVMNSYTQECLVNENTMAATLNCLQDIIPRHRQFQPSAINVQELTTDHKPDHTDSVNNKSIKKL